MKRVFKFGGALMTDATGVKKVASVISSFKNDELIVVVSAMGKTTNALEHLLNFSLSGNQKETEQAFLKLRQFHFEMAETLIGDARNCVYDKLDDAFVRLNKELKNTAQDKYIAYDQVVCFGELFSSILVDAYLKNIGLPSHLVDAHSVIVTNSNFTSAKVDWQFTQKAIESRVKPILENGEIVLTQGFIGANHEGVFTTLGREGSDFTAAIFANILETDEVSIWKDVPGLMNADPKLFENTVKLDQISYHEAIELAFYGASVVHPKTIQPVQQKNIPLKVRSFYEPDSEPTVISSTASEDDKIHKLIVKENQVLLSIASRDLSFVAEENLTQIFDAFSRHKIHVNLMQHSAVSFSVCFTEDQDKLQGLVDELKNEFLLKYNIGLTLVTIRHYTPELIDEHSAGKKIYLEQRSRNTIQLLVR
jgi:aspartate kinase